MSREEMSTREKILKASMDLLESGPGTPVRMSDIAKRAGITRQALYLHFATRAELLIEVTHYVDQLKGSEERLIPSRTAATGIERLDAFVEGWVAYIPEIYGTAKALLAMQDTDEEARKAWTKRMLDMREGCEAAIVALQNDGTLSPAYSPKDATDILWTMLSVRNWEQMTQQCGWSQAHYAKILKSTARRLFVEERPER